MLLINGCYNQPLIITLSTEQTLTIDEPGAYTVTISDGDCEVEATKEVIEESLLDLKIYSINDLSLICKGSRNIHFGIENPVDEIEKYNWEVTQGGSYQSDGAPNILLKTVPSRSFEVKVSVGEGECVTENAISITVKSGSHPNSEIFNRNESMGLNTLVYLNNTMISYFWGYDSDSTKLSPTLLENEIYQNYIAIEPIYVRDFYWVITEKNGCQSRTYYNPPYERKGQEMTAELVTVLPNPNQGRFILEIPNSYSKILSISIFDYYGRQIADNPSIDSFASDRYSVAVPHLVPGVYFVQINTEDQSHLTQKFVITR